MTTHVCLYFRVREPLLATRRVIYREHGLVRECAKEWLGLAKACRQVRNFSVATEAVLSAAGLGAPTAVVEHAKLLYADNQVSTCADLFPVALVSDAWISAGLTCMLARLLDSTRHQNGRCGRIICRGCVGHGV